MASLMPVENSTGKNEFFLCDFAVLTAVTTKIAIF
jgi:hypothetical protein